MFGISVFGDSITFGRGDLKNRGWCGRLRQDFESKDYYNCLYNLGICGNTSSDLLARFDTEAKARIKFIRDGDKQVIIFAIGINDTRLLNKEEIPEINLNEFKQNIQTLIEQAKKYTSDILFIGLTPVDEKITSNYEKTRFINSRIKSYNESIKELCNASNIPFFDMFRELSNIEYEPLLDDGLHPNSKGYQKMYDLISKFLQDNKILE